MNSCVGDGIDLHASNVIVYIIFNSELHVCNVLLSLKQSLDDAYLHLMQKYNSQIKYKQSNQLCIIIS